VGAPPGPVELTTEALVAARPSTSGEDGLHPRIRLQDRDDVVIQRSRSQAHGCVIAPGASFPWYPSSPAPPSRLPAPAAPTDGPTVLAPSSLSRIRL